MKLKGIMVMIVVNTFFLCMFSVYLEYNRVSENIKGIETKFDLAVDTALSACMSSEEMFSDNKTYSSNNISSTNTEYSTLKVMRNGHWVQGNLYVMSHFYTTYGYFPRTTGEYNSHLQSIGGNGNIQAYIYSWLFGSIGDSWKDPNLAWANSKSSGYYSVIGGGGSRQPTNEFKSFYESAGKYITQRTPVKIKSGVGDSWTISYREVPSLVNMGLRLSEYNETTSGITADSFVQVLHTGKNNDMYYLTPYSLGVTYVDPRVFQPTFLSNLEQLIRFNRSKSSVNNYSDSQRKQDYQLAEGCLGTSVYALSATDTMFNSNIMAGGSDTAQIHKEIHASNTYLQGTSILNDGNVEYDMDSVKTSIEYYLVDFFDNSNYKIVNYIEGSTPYSLDLEGLPSRLSDVNTSQDSNGLRLVAKVSVSMRLHIPYKSSLLQWFCYGTRQSDASQHYDIKDVVATISDDGRLTNMTIDNSSDGVIYKYTTYVAVTN